VSQIEARITEVGWGSSIKVDGIEVPDVKSFKIDAQVESASVSVDLVGCATVIGSVQRVTYEGTVFVLLNEDNDPIKVVCDRDAMERHVRDGSAQGFIEVPVEVNR
jgi:zona occludens toxin (predicted ATPase)